MTLTIDAGPFGQHAAVRFDFDPPRPVVYVDAWYEEAERVEVRARDPYDRVDSAAAARRVTAAVEGMQPTGPTGPTGPTEPTEPTRPTGG